MVILKCSECGSTNVTLDGNCDITCKDCGYGSYIENFRLDELDSKIKELKEIIYNRKMALYKYLISKSDCPWKHGLVKTDNINIICDEMLCKKCIKEFWKTLGTKIKNEINEF